MKNKNLIILFLVLLILIYPLEKAYAQSLLDIIGEVGKTVSNFFVNIANALNAARECFGNPIFCGLSILINIITWVFHQILWFFNIYIFAYLVDKASELDPFYITEQGAPAAVAWSILVGYGFIILVFSGLSVAYDWLFGQDATALRKIFIIIFVALIINFTFVGIQEAFKVIRSFERGITNNQSEMIGTIMAASLWQKDPFQTINQIAETIKGNTTFKYLTQAILYLFIVAFDMGMFIILIVTLVLFIARYFYILALTAISPLAVASLTFPEFQTIPALRELFSGLRFAGEWFSRLVKWLLVVPIFVILVLLCNITKENILAQIGAGDLIQFIMLFLGFGFCYMGSLKVAVSLGGMAAAWARGIATALLLGIGALATKLTFRATQGTIGGILTKAGRQLEEKVGVGGILGWRSWVGQRIGKPIKEAGERILERRYRLDAEAVKAKIRTIDEQLRKETEPEKIQALTSQLANLTQQFRNVPYVLRSINEEIGVLSRSSFAKIASNKEALSLIAGKEVPRETREKVIGQIDKLRRSEIRALTTDAEWLKNLQNLSPDVADAFVEKIGEELKEPEIVELLTKEDIRRVIPEVPEHLRRTLNIVTRGFVSALLEKNLENISVALASWDRNFWLRPGNTQMLDNVLSGYNLTEEDKKAIILDTLRKTENKGAMIIGALKEGAGGPLDTILRKLTDQEKDEIRGLLTPQERAAFNSIITRPA
jgi:hypothetical protein